MSERGPDLRGLDRPELELLAWLRERDAGVRSAISTRDVALRTRWSEEAVGIMLARLLEAGCVVRIRQVYECYWRPIKVLDERSPPEFGRLLTMDPAAAYDVLARRPR